MPTDFTRLTPSAMRAELDAIARDAQLEFGALDSSALNWRPDATRWSIAQCLEHLLLANGAMFAALDATLDARQPASVWQRLPFWPALMGRLLIRSQAPRPTRRFTAPSAAQPLTSAIDAAIVARFVEHQHEATTRLQAMEQRDLARIVMTSPFSRVITYSVLDGWRLIVTHERRHLEQAKRVKEQSSVAGTRASGVVA
jgi:hypothetical protein